MIALDPKNLIKIADNTLITNEELFKDHNFPDTHLKLAENGLFMPSTVLFTPYLMTVDKAAKGGLGLYNGSNEPLSLEQILKLRKKLFTDTWVWLNTGFTEDPSTHELLFTNYEVINGKLETKTLPLENYLDDNCYASLEFNSQGLPIKKSEIPYYTEDKNIFYLRPAANSVIRFYSNSQKMNLYSVRNYLHKDPSLGTFGCLNI